MNLEQLKLGLQLRRVSRFQTHYLPTRQQVDQHSFRATLLYIFLGGTEIEAMLLHDAEESLTGDIPSPAKEHISGLDYFDQFRVPFNDPEQKKLGKLCDKLELVVDLKEQRAFFGGLGEQINEIYENELDKVKDLARELKLTKQVNKLLKEIV